MPFTFAVFLCVLMEPLVVLLVQPRNSLLLHTKDARCWSTCFGRALQQVFMTVWELLVVLIMVGLILGMLGGLIYGVIASAKVGEY